MYCAFENEDALFPNDLDKCYALYIKRSEEIQVQKGKIMPHLDNVVQGRDMAEETLENIGDELDSRREQDDDVAREEQRNDEEYVTTESGGLIPDNTVVSNVGGDRTFKRIDLIDSKDLYIRLRNLDIDQRTVIERVVGFARKLRMADNQPTNNTWPTPQYLIVHGNAGTGKSHVIDLLGLFLQKILCKSGDVPDHPYIVKMGYTGTAAAIIDGQTINYTFQLPLSNEIISLGDKVRDLRKKQLENLIVIIIDEISLVRSDMLYQIHFRLAKELKQNNLPFGNIAVVVLGDLLQMKPIGGNYVFQEPFNEKSKMLHAIDPLWEMFTPISLKTNHRQGRYGDYADLLNRVRVGRFTQDDIELLQTRVFPRDSPHVPKSNAIFCSGTNKIVNKFNNNRLNELQGNLMEFKAQVFETKGKRVYNQPQLDNAGNILNTPLQHILQLKIGARVMLTHNISVGDNLVNGSLGEVTGFKFLANGKVKFIMVNFDQDTSGRQRRSEINLESEFPGATAIDVLEFEYNTGRRRKGKSATAINFPLRLAWGITFHKIQGHTIKEPMTLILDFDCWLLPSMVYVGLSRVQTLNQLYILGKLPIEPDCPHIHDPPSCICKKMHPHPAALEELERLIALEIPLPQPSSDPNELEIVSLNTISLSTHIQDIKADPTIMSAQVILLQETSFPANTVMPGPRYDLPDRESQFASLGHRRGLATYFPSSFNHQNTFLDQKFQIATITSDMLNITNVYRSNVADKHFTDMLAYHTSDDSKTQLILGDFNYCQRDEPNHPVKVFLESNGFYPALNPPQSTHIQGRCIDQIWVKKSHHNIEILSASVNTCLYSDHESIKVKIRFNSDEAIIKDKAKEITPNIVNIQNWIENKKKEGKFKGEVFDAYVNNGELQNIWEECKENYDDQLPQQLQECYLFTEFEDMNNFMNYWRITRGFVGISAAKLNVGDGTIETALRKFFRKETAQAQKIHEKNMEETGYCDNCGNCDKMDYF